MKVEPPADPDAVASARLRRTAALVEALNVVETRLDPAPAKRGQRIADVATFLILAVAVLVLGFPLERPFRLLAALVIAAGATRLIRHVRLRRLRREHERLVAELDAVGGGGT